MEEIKKIQGLVEDVLRGKLLDETKLLDNCKQFVTWSSTKPIDSLLHNDTKKELFSASIQLHNKLRSLPTSVAEAKGYIKAACAWLIVRTGDMKPSLAENYMKVFIRAGQELTAMENVEAKKVALNCLDQALSSWQSTTPAVFEKSLNPIEYQQLKSSIIQSYVIKLKTVHELGNADQKAMNECVRRCREMIQSAQYNVKLNFIKVLSSIAQHLAQFQPKEKHMDDAAYYFSTALQCLDALPKADVESISKTNGASTLLWLKIRLNLSLSYVHCERNEFEKAMECINICEALSLEPMALQNRPAGSDPERDKKEIFNALNFAKFTINCKACDHEGAKTNLKFMINAISTSASSSTLGTLLKSIQAFERTMEHKKSEDVLPLYKATLVKFKDINDSFNAIRIAMLTFFLQATEFSSTVNDEEMNPMALCDAIVSDHVSASSSLSASQLALMRSLLRQRIAWHRLNEQHREAIRWCDQLTPLSEHQLFPWLASDKSHIPIGESCYWGEATLNSWRQSTETREFDPKECYTTSLLQKAESLLSLHERSEALSAAMSAAHATLNTRTACIAFLCSAYVYDDLDKSIELLLSLLWPYNLDDQGHIAKLYPCCNKGLIHTLAPSFKIMTLERIMICAQLIDDKLASESSEDISTRLYLCRERLFYEWLRMFEEWEIYNCFKEIGEDHDEDAQIVAVDVTVRNAAEEIARDDQPLSGEFDSRFRDNISYLSVLNTIFYNFVVKNFDESHYHKNENVIDGKNGSGSGEDEHIVVVGAKRPIDTNSTSTTIIMTASAKMLATDDDCNSKPIPVPVPMSTTRTTMTTTPISNGIENEITSEQIQILSADSSKRIEVEEDELNYEKKQFGTATTTKQPSCTVAIKCSMEDIHDQLKKLETVVKMRRSNVDAVSLGTGDDYFWLGDYCWNIGASLLNQFCSIGRDTTNSEHSLEITNDRLADAADFLEFSDYFYSFVELDQVSKNQIYQSIRTNQAIALLISSAARLDLHKNNLMDVVINDSQSNKLLNSALYNTRRARYLLQLNGGFGDHRLQKHMSKSLILELRNICYRSCEQALSSTKGDSELHESESILSLSIDIVPELMQLPDFYDKNKDLFNCYMQPVDLQHCANVARKFHGGNLEVSRCLLDMAIQISQRDPYPDYHFIGNMYYDLISTAGTRQKAFQKIEDFLQLITTLGNQSDENIQLFSADDVDAVCSISYNYGVSLMELGNFDFAEKFISKSLALLAFTSQSLTGWKSNMQDAYSQVLRAKVDARSLTSKREISTIFELEKNVDADSTGAYTTNANSAQILNASMFE